MSNDSCKNSPALMDGQHVYEIEGVCRYCGEKEPMVETIERVSVKTPGAKCPTAGPINKDLVNGMLLAYEMNGHIVAAQARMDGMKADNKVCETQGLTPMYRYSDFQAEVSNIDRYTSYIRVMRNHLTNKPEGHINHI